MLIMWLPCEDHFWWWKYTLLCCFTVTFCRQMLLCRVTLGKSFLQFSAIKMAHAPPGHHSVIGRPSTGGLTYAEYVVYRGEQVSVRYKVVTLAHKTLSSGTPSYLSYLLSPYAPSGSSTPPLLIFSLFLDWSLLSALLLSVYMHVRNS